MRTRRIATTLGFSLAISLAAGASALPSMAAATSPLQVLFIGNSFTYTRPPAMNYNTDAVDDMNYENFLANPEDGDPALPQPWGGVPAIVSKLAEQAGVALDIHHSLRGGASLRGHFLNTNPAGWDLRANIAAKRWDIVVIQGNSTEAVDRAGGDYAQFSAYVRKIEGWIHDGTALTYRDSDLFPGGTTALRRIPANPNANPAALVYLYQTWARPDLTYPAGSPYEGEPLETMTRDVRDAYAMAALEDQRITAIAPVGEAFMRAVRNGVALRDPYTEAAAAATGDDEDSDGTVAKHADRGDQRRGHHHGGGKGKPVNLWWYEDWFHPSGHGAYLSALVMFGTLTRIDPASFGADEDAAADLDIRPSAARRLQQVASEQLRASGFDLQWVHCQRDGPRGKSYGQGHDRGRGHGHGHCRR